METMKSDKILDRIKGSLICGAAGDALGYAVEFIGEKEIFKKYGAEGITQYDLYAGEALISDDTQMALFTAMACILGSAEPDAASSLTPYRMNLVRCYKDWYLTQTQDFPAKRAFPGDWLMQVKGLYSRRAPGGTCMTAIRSGCDGTMEEPVNQSKGCGGIMRVAPIALHFAEIGKPIEEADLLAAHACALTHGHPFGYLSGAALVHIIYRIMEGYSVRDAMTDAADALPSVFPDCRHHACQTSDLIRKAVDLADQDLSDLDAIHQLGEGWVGEEALAIAVYCACKYPDDPDRCLIAAVNHKGDSDSTGAVAGNIVGAAVGYEAIPDKYREHLELSGTILKIADQLRTRR